MKINKEKAGLISKNPIWVGWDNYYLYTSDTFIGLIWKMITEWKHDRHLVG